MNKFIGKKINLAEILHKSTYASYADSVLILCAALSAIAAYVWPGDDRIDKKRFIELIITYADSKLKNNWISIPLLHQSLNAKNKSPFVSDVYRKLLDSGRILAGDDIDLSENDLIKRFACLEKKVIREFSYPNLIYKELRCAYSHEYTIGGNANSNPMTSRDIDVSYVNRLELKENITRKMICFHFSYLSALLKHLNKTLYPLENYCDLSRPNVWWIDAI